MPSNNINMMSIPELDKAKVKLTALQETWDIVDSLIPKETIREVDKYKKIHLRATQFIIQSHIDVTEAEIESIEKESAD